LPSGHRFAYAAPEVILGQPAGLKSDIFSMGVVLHEVRSSSAGIVLR
jgi:serine/threonine protein kinase